MTTYVRDPFVITNTMRRYNPKTSRYESIVTKKPDPWEGAPKGIRVDARRYRGVYTEAGSWWNTGGGWSEPRSGGEPGLDRLRIQVKNGLRFGYRFVDFDGAPKGQRFYVQWESNSAFEPGVDTGNGVHVLIRGKWWKQSGIDGLEWYRDNGIKPILVDPAPEEPKTIPSEKFYYYDLVGRGDKLNADEVRQAHLVIAVDKAGKVRVEKSRHFAQPVN